MFWDVLRQQNLAGDFCNLSLDQLKQVLCDQAMGQALAGRTGNKRDEIEPVSQVQIQDAHYAKWKPSTNLNDPVVSPETVLVSILGRRFFWEGSLC